MNDRQAVLYLEDGSLYRGESFGSPGRCLGEVVFNTSMTGYQEVLTDPSYAGQIVCMTHPQIGNYGTNPQDAQSRRPFVSGFAVREFSRVYSNWRANQSLQEYLAQHGIPCISGIDTRALVRRIRSQGAMRGIIASGDVSLEQLKSEVSAHPPMLGSDYVRSVTTDRSYSCQPDEERFHVVAYDLGIKSNILRSLTSRGCRVTVVPASTSDGEALSLEPDGIFISNGPGDPEPLQPLVDNVRRLIGKKPIFGICLGQQVLGLALGGKTFKLKFGHRGGNQPVQNLATRKVEITSQNHGFCVDADSLQASQVELTHINLNDQTLEGLRHRSQPLFSVQYHPEASPGPHDSLYLFDEFVKLMEGRSGWSS